MQSQDQENQIKASLKVVQKKLFRRRLFSSIGMAIFVGFIATFVFQLIGTSTYLQAIILLGLLPVITLILIGLKGKHQAGRLISYLNLHESGFEHSAQLFFDDRQNDFEKSILARLQRNKITPILVKFAESHKVNWSPVYRNLWLAFVGLILTLSASILIPAGGIFQNQLQIIDNFPVLTASVSDKIQSLSLTEVQLNIQSPHYTGKQSEQQNKFDFLAPADSRITIQVGFSEAVDQVYLTFGSGRRINLRPSDSGQNHRTTFTVSERDIYQLIAVGNSGYSSDDSEEIAFKSPYFRCDIIPDATPDLIILTPADKVIMEHTDSFTTALSAVAYDDYGLTSVRMMATLTRGEGESVQFRSDTIAIDHIKKEGKNRWLISHTIDPVAMGMSPGDDLYFYLEATDNHEENNAGDNQSAGQKTRSSTLFVIWKDSASTPIISDMGIQVDLLPEYFRSQRQIIIDTERLVPLQSSLKPKIYWQRSNNIAYDQKILRLRYGQFLGEEFASDAGGSGEGSDNNPDHEDDDDDSEEHETLDEHNHEDGITENPTEVAPIFGQGIDMGLMGHMHDQAEAATFLPEPIKLLLKKSLSNMWQAELHLRLGEPTQALPYEYAALKYLKEVQQSSRVYVKKVGFDPPPIDENEMRFSGKLADILSPEEQAIIKHEENIILTNVLAVFQSDNQLNRAEKQASLSAGVPLLIKASLSTGGPLYLTALDKLQNAITDSSTNEQLSAAETSILHRAFWSLLPSPELQAVPAGRRTSLESLFRNELFSSHPD